MALVSTDMIADFERDGAVCLRGAFRDWVDVLADGVERNMREPGPYAAENLKPGEEGRFFDDYCNWQRIPEFERFLRESDIARIAAEIMGSNEAQLFHDHVLVKEPGTGKQTPWHQDAPYYFVAGEQCVSFWLPLDPVEHATLRLIAGSHKWEKPVRPVRWLNDADFYEGAEGEELDFIPVPDPDMPDEDNPYSVLEWGMAPGDAVLFHFRTVHGARGNETPHRRRAFSARFVGDDTHYVTRPGRTSPPFPGHGMADGERLREDWFPILYEGGLTAS